MAYLEDLGCLGTALDGFEVILVDEFTLVLVNVKGLGGRQGR